MYAVHVVSQVTRVAGQNQDVALHVHGAVVP
jgi:hypothetical protein